jgi:hypothetical protein
MASELDHKQWRKSLSEQASPSRLTRRRGANRLVVSLAALAVVGGGQAAGAGGAGAAREGTGGVAQFAAWGSAGPALAPAPAGWTEAPAEEGLPEALAPTAEETARGFVLFTRDPFSPFAPAAAPAPAERGEALAAVAARGQYVPLALGLYALEDLRETQVTLPELRAGEAAVIPAANLEARVARSVRVVVDGTQRRFGWEPFLLEKRGAVAVPKGRVALVWLTVKAPAGAAAGRYRGWLTVRAAGREAAQVELSVEVLPFSLPPAPIEMAVYYPRPAESDATLEQELVDLREHGVIPVPNLEARVRSRDRVFGEDDVAETRAYCRRLLGATKAVYGGWKFPVTFEAGHQILYGWDPGKNWFVHWEHSLALERDFAKAIALVQDLAGEYQVPALRLYVNDEAGAHGLLAEAVYDNGLAKARFPQLATTATIGGGLALGYDEIGQLQGVVDFFSANRFTPETARALAGLGRPYGVYNGAGPTPAGARFFFGFYGWKTGAAQIGQWVYSFGESVFRGNGLRQEDEGYVYPAADGPLPSLTWEAVRAGVDDYRYLDLLWRMSAAAQAGGNTAARAAAAEARGAVTNILGQIGWGFQALQSGDRTPPPHPATLRKWRGRVVQEILELRAALPGATDFPAGQRPGALDLPWREAEAEPVTFGPELLPPSDFEAGLKPWRVEAWKGQGHGELASDERHSGQKSVRIEVPAGSDNDAVTVLVWPQDGDGRLNLSLEKERVYEFAAWVKRKDRPLPPDLRISLPGSAAGSVRTGRDAATGNGWQRLWTRVELRAPAQPAYLAVWFQGPGTAWVDDLSLREVLPPPVTLVLDQEEYDAQDKVATGTLTLARRLQPAQVRVSVVSVDGTAVEEVTVPYAARFAKRSASGRLMLAAPARLERCRFSFEPAALAAGPCECRVVLLDPEGRELARRSARFVRK